MKRILSLITIISIFAVCLSGCDNNSVYESYIEEVKNGYLGGCTNVTVEEVFSELLVENGVDTKQIAVKL